MRFTTPEIACFRTVVLVVVCACTAACAADPSPDAQPARPDNVILILVDTLRADHLGCYGYPRDTSPNLDAFAASALRFDRARAQAACTFPSVNSMLTSRYTARFLGQPDHQVGIPQDVPTLAAVLRGAGLAALAVSASPIVRATPGGNNPHGGYGGGFDVFDEGCLWDDAECVNRRALQLLDKTEGPFFLFLHFMDPHDPYVPPPSFEGRFSSGYEGHDFIAAGDPNPIAEMLYDDGPRIEVSAGDRQHLVDLYDDEIAYWDEQLQVLLLALEERGLAETTMIVVSADHGEEFLDHGHIKHCRALFDASTRTPLVMRIPGVGGQGPIAAPAQNLDIMPTILDYLAVDVTGLELQGTSLRPAIESETAGGLAFSMQYPSCSADDGRFKLITSLEDGSQLLFDLVEDPGETRDLSDLDPATVERLQGELKPWVAGEVATEGGQAGLDALEGGRELLRALGYLE